MKKSTIAKYSVQAVGAGFGILGLMWLYLGVHAVVRAIRDSELFLLFMPPMFFAFGGIVLAIAWQTLRHFGPKAIQNVVGLVAFAFYTSMMAYIRPFADTTSELNMPLHHAVTYLIPILLAYLFYSVASRQLINTTKEDIQHQPAP